MLKHEKHKFHLANAFLYRRLDNLKHGCGGETKIIGSASSSRHPEFFDSSFDSGYG